MLVSSPRRSNARRLWSHVRESVTVGLSIPLKDAPIATWALVPVFGAVTLLLGLAAGQLDPGLAVGWRVLWLPLILVVYPSFVEEVFYRGILLPRSLAGASRRRRFGAVTASTALYVAAHPISPLLGLSDSDFFLDPRMLFVVAMLGYTCGYAYLRSGSLRAPILIHWATVVVWNLLLGGVYST